jgi:hypothetical protein
MLRHAVEDHREGGVASARCFDELSMRRCSLLPSSLVLSLSTDVAVAAGNAST